MTPPRLLLPLALTAVLAGRAPAEPLPGTQPLEFEGDPAARIVAGIDTYLDGELAAAASTFWTS